MSWDITSPADTDPIRQGANAIRTLKVDAQSALQTEGVFPGATPASPVFRWKPRRGTQVSRPANDAVNPGTLYYNTDLNEWEVDTGTAWVALAHAIPSGSVEAYMGTSAPGGWLFCDGSAVSRTTYAGLFAVLGTACGNGDGATTFNLPDFRGQFLRGVDGSAGRDPDKAARTAMASGGNTGNNPGSVQPNATAKNGLALTDPGHAHTIPANGIAGTAAFTKNVDGSGATETSNSAVTGITLGAGDSETRPTNAYVNFIIKT